MGLLEFLSEMETVQTIQSFMPWQAFLEGEHRPMVQSMRSQGEAEYVAGINTEVDAPPQITVQRQEEVVEGGEAQGRGMQPTLLAKVASYSGIGRGKCCTANQNRSARFLNNRNGGYKQCNGWIV